MTTDRKGQGYHLYYTPRRTDDERVLPQPMPRLPRLLNYDAAREQQFMANFVSKYFAPKPARTRKPSIPAALKAALKDWYAADTEHALAPATAKLNALIEEMVL